MKWGFFYHSIGIVSEGVVLKLDGPDGVCEGTKNVWEVFTAIGQKKSRCTSTVYKSKWNGTITWKRMQQQQVCCHWVICFIFHLNIYNIYILSTTTSNTKFTTYKYLNLVVSFNVYQKEEFSITRNGNIAFLRKFLKSHKPHEHIAPFSLPPTYFI